MKVVECFVKKLITIKVCIVLALLCACASPEKNNEEQVQEEEKIDIVEVMEVLDSCVKMVDNVDWDVRMYGIRIGVTIAEYVRYGQISNLSIGLIEDIFVKLDTVMNHWQISEEPEGYRVFSHEVPHNEDWFAIDMRLDENGSIYKGYIFFPLDAVKDFIIAYTNVTELDPDIDWNNSGIFNEESLLYSIDNYMKYDESYYAELDSVVLSPMLNYKYVYFFYRDMNDEFQSSRCRLLMLQEQHKELYGI